MVFIVAEIGVNWDGNYELVREMMEKSKIAGCDAVKFQAFSEDMVSHHPEKNRLMKSSITETNVSKINEISKSIGIEWFCTPMYPEAVKFLNPYVNKFKIRFGDAKVLFQGKDSSILRNILKTGKEVIISSEENPKKCKIVENPQIKWLYVVPKYPCNLEDLDFSELKDFEGYSNHCPHILAPLTAVILGAKIIEVHITSDKSKKFFDNNVSFDYNELEELVKLIRLADKIKR